MLTPYKLRYDGSKLCPICPLLPLPGVELSIGGAPETDGTPMSDLATEAQPSGDSD